MLRTALTVSALKQQPFRMKNIRSSRTNPGLKTQHLKAVETVQRLTDAEVEGAEIGSEKLKFKPGRLKQESFTVNTGTAASTTLLFDTVLPLSKEIGMRYTVKGGTDVKWSPTMPYFRHVKLPLLEKFGVKASVDVERTGYYPRGGGKATLRIEKSELKPLEITEKGDLEKLEIYSKSSKELEDQNVAERQADEAARILKNSYVSVPLEKNISYIDTDSPGSTVLVKAVYENSIAGFDVLGEKGKRSENVAKEAVQKFKKFHASDAAVDKHMADQLAVFLALKKGNIRIFEATQHVRTIFSVLNSFGKNLKLQTDSKQPEISK